MVVSLQWQHRLEWQVELASAVELEEERHEGRVLVGQEEAGGAQLSRRRRPPQRQNRKVRLVGMFIRPSRAVDKYFLRIVFYNVLLFRSD